VGILRHDFPNQVLHDPHYQPPDLPATALYLEDEGLAPFFIDYLRGWSDFVDSAPSP
jgi:hypothetical protein